MNLANRLTLTRIGLIPFFVSFALLENVTSRTGIIAAGRWAALVIFIAAAITDYYDGMLARRDNMVTNFGKLFDPLADKLLTMSAFVVLVELRVPPDRPIFPAWAIILILGREFLVTGLRSLASAQGRVIQADRWGKHKTVWQLATIITMFVALCTRDTLRLARVDIEQFDRWFPYLSGMLLAVVMFLTVTSGILYLVNNRDVLRDQN